MILDSSLCSLLVVDIQEKLFPKIFESEKVERFSQLIIKICSKLKIPIVLSEQYPKGLGKTIPKIISELKSYPVKTLEKTSFSCFPLKSNLNTLDKFIKTKQIILIGIETHICILQTALDLKKLGFDVYVIKEAVGSRKINDKEIAITRMIQAGIKILNFEMMLFELIRDSNNVHFKELSKLVK